MEPNPRSTSNGALMVLCDRCDRESLVRLGEQFLCASCAMNVLRESVEDFEGSATPRSLEPIELLTCDEPESVLAQGLEVGRRVREGTMHLVDAAAAHHQALGRSMRGARDIDECVRRVEAGAVLFKAWAFSFDARLVELEQRNRALLLALQELERHVGRVPLRRQPGVGFGRGSGERGMLGRRDVA